MHLLHVATSAIARYKLCTKEEEEEEEEEEKKKNKTDMEQRQHRLNSRGNRYISTTNKYVVHCIKRWVSSPSLLFYCR
jgi:VIT1/CCC1 family predicted Fe2+/Mn2+ transporter